MEEKQFAIAVAVPRPLGGLFTYAIPEKWLGQASVGNWVEVPFGRAKTHAFIARGPVLVSELGDSLPPGIRLKSVQAIGEQGRVVPEDVWELCEWAAQYYHAPLGEVLNTATPAASLGMKSKKKVARAVAPYLGVASELELNSAQKRVAVELEEYLQGAQVALLQGITGSGKTEIYLHLARRALSQGKSVLVLVPEIALTPQLNRRFEEGLGRRVALWHSALADGVRRDLSWALREKQIQVVVGARSAVFAPIQDLGLIIVDEEHDSTYKQEDRFRYQARDLAIVRGRIKNCPVLLGSATPSFESLERCEAGRYRRFELKERAVVGASMPTLDCVDLTSEIWVQNTQAPIAERTLEAIRETVARGEQVMVFLNRRGFAAFLICEECGEVRECRHCSISLTVHQKQGLLKCHTCGFQEQMPLQCSKCQGVKLRPMGAGTESLEEQLPRLLEGIRVLRLDRDQVTSATRLEQVLDHFRAGDADVLLGTQMLVKGHDFPQVTLVVVMLADSLFRWPDFRSSERALQVLTQVAGRAGRGVIAGKVMIQTFSPEHPVVQAVLQQVDAHAWYEQEKALRRELGYPPFGRLVKFRVEGATREEASSVARHLFDFLEKQPEAVGVEILGPTEAMIERVKDTFRWEIMLKSARIPPLHQLISRVKAAQAAWQGRLIVDVDPSGVG